jgi:hypothetical protein
MDHRFEAIETAVLLRDQVLVFRIQPIAYLFEKKTRLYRWEHPGDLVVKCIMVQRGRCFRREY